MTVKSPTGAGAHLSDTSSREEYVSDLAENARLFQNFMLVFKSEEIHMALATQDWRCSIFERQPKEAVADIRSSLKQQKHTQRVSLFTKTDSWRCSMEKRSGRRESDSSSRRRRHHFARDSCSATRSLLDEAFSSTASCQVVDNSKVPKMPASLEHMEDKKNDFREHSPTSTVLQDGRFSSQVVAMGETGAEVILSSLRRLDDASSPQRRPLRPVNALLDTEEYSMSSPVSLARNNSTAASMASLATTTTPPDLPFCGLPGCWQHHHALVEDGGSDTMMEWKINCFLGIPSSSSNADDWFDGWQAWSYFQSTAGADHYEALTNHHHPGLKETVQRSLYNRVSDLSQRRDRLATLRRDLCPFDSQTGAQPLSKVNSFSQVNNSNKQTRHASQGSPPPASTKSASLWGCGTVYCAMEEDDLDPSPKTLRYNRSRLNSGHDGYDSDPEDFTRIRSLNQNQQQRQVFSQNKENRTDPHVDFHDDDSIHLAVQQYMNGMNLTLILHERSKRPWENSHAVHAWIERGQILSTETITPKWVWTHMSKRSETCSLDLLDVHRILAVQQLDRNRHPFARRRHTFEIRTIHESFLFEASSSSERDRIVRGLKLVIARLATQLIVSDPHMADEFFLTSGQHGPGEEPVLF